MSWAAGWDADRAPFCNERSRVRTLRLCNERAALWRARLAADLVFAIALVKAEREARGARAACQLVDLSCGFNRRRRSSRGSPESALCAPELSPVSPSRREKSSPSSARLGPA